jgi:CubicO group peptidase (beta-lactamase class C family)
VFRTVPIERGDVDIWILPRRMIDSDDLNREQVSWDGTRQDAQEVSVSEWLSRSETDALLVLHDGEIVAEQYFGDMGPHTRHIIWCGSKAILATVVAPFLLDGTLDEGAPVTKYVPEFSNTGFDGATIRQLLDQTTCVRCREWIEPGDLGELDPEAQSLWNYGTPRFRLAEHDYARSSRALGMFPNRPHEPTLGYYDLLFGLDRRENRDQGAKFEYRDVNPMALQLILERTTGRSYVQHLTEFWQKLGPEDSAALMLDPIGTPVGCYGPAVTLRDWARWGQMVCDRGAAGTERVLPGVAELVDDIRQNPGAEMLDGNWNTPMPNIGYRSLFWTASAERGRNPLLQAAGWCLQKCLIDFERKNVVVQLASFWDQAPDKLANNETPKHGDLAIWSFVDRVLPRLIS